LGKPEQKPRSRLTQAQNAHQFGISVRSLQRAGRILREAPDLAAQVEAKTLKIGAAERILREREEQAGRAWLRAQLGH
jgi:hypothetical protein